MEGNHIESDELYSSDDDFEDYDAYLGKCKKHINNVAVVNKRKIPLQAKVTILPKEKKNTTVKKQVSSQQQASEQQASDKQQAITIENIKPMVTEEPVDDWESLLE